MTLHSLLACVVLLSGIKSPPVPMPAAQGVSLTVDAPKPVPAGEPVPVFYTLTNGRKDTITCSSAPFPLTLDVRVELKGPGGSEPARLAWAKNIDRRVVPPTARVPAGMSRTEGFLLNRVYDLSEPGTYTLRLHARVYLGRPGRRGFFRVRLSSKAVKITITKERPLRLPGMPLPNSGREARARPAPE